MPRKPVKTNHFVEKIIKHIRDNNYQGGELLESQNAMMEKYGVSYPVVYYGLQELCRLNIIYRVKGKGTYVKPREHISRNRYIVINIKPRDDNQLNFIYLSCFENIRNKFLEKGYFVRLNYSLGEFGPEQKMIYENQIVGAVFFALYTNRTRQDRSFEALLSKRNIPVIHIESNPKDKVNNNTISLDHYHAGQLLAKELVKKKLKNICLISYHYNGIMKLRLQGFRNYCADKGIKPNILTLEGFYTVSREQLASIDGIAVLSEALTQTVLFFAKKHGIKIPEQTRLIAIDGTTFSTHLKPKITTLDHPFDKIARATVENMDKMIKGKLDKFPLTTIEPGISYRESL